MAPASSAAARILNLPTLLARCRDARAQGLRIVHCHGCFDIVHPGHVRHLQFAARLGDLLLVTISGDGMIDKGTGRPLIPESLRAENLAALDCVDWVYIDPHPTALEIIEQVRPDVYLKGREYESNRDPRFLAEREAVERHGGRVVFSSGDVVFSSSALIAALTEQNDPLERRLAQLTETNDLRPSTLDDLIARFKDKRIVVIGEPIIDCYIHCERPEVASESPVMTLRPVEGTTYDGGAAIVCRHLAALGATVELVTALPADDPVAEGLIERLRIEGISVRFVTSDQPVMEKQRYLVGHQKVMKVDLGRPLTIDERGRARFVELAVEAVNDGVGGQGSGARGQRSGVTENEPSPGTPVPGTHHLTPSSPSPADAVIFCDFGQGLLTPATLDRLIERLRPMVQTMAGDVSGRRANLLRLHHMDLVCPTEEELREAMHDFADGLGAVVWRWFEQTGVRSALVTMGAEGVIAFAKGQTSSFPRQMSSFPHQMSSFPRRRESSSDGASGSIDSPLRGNDILAHWPPSPDPRPPTPDPRPQPPPPPPPRRTHPLARPDRPRPAGLRRRPAGDGDARPHRRGRPRPGGLPRRPGRHHRSPPPRQPPHRRRLPPRRMATPRRPPPAHRVGGVRNHRPHHPRSEHLQRPPDHSRQTHRRADGPRVPQRRRQPQNVLRQYPSLDIHDIRACLSAAAELMKHQYVIKQTA